MGNSVEGRFPVPRLPRRRVRGGAARSAAAARPGGEVRAAASRRAASPAAIHARPKQPYRAPIADVFAGADAPAYVARAARARRARATRGCSTRRPSRASSPSSTARRTGGQRDRRDGARRLDLPDARPRPVRREPAARSAPRADAESWSATRRDVGPQPSRAGLMGWTPPQLLVQDSLGAAAEAAPTRTAVLEERDVLTLRASSTTRPQVRARAPGQRPRARRSRRALPRQHGDVRDGDLRDAARRRRLRRRQSADEGREARLRPRRQRGRGPRRRGAPGARPPQRPRVPQRPRSGTSARSRPRSQRRSRRGRAEPAETRQTIPQRPRRAHLHLGHDRASRRA